MLVSYKLLQTYFDNPLPEPHALAETLTMHAFEVENLERCGDDIIFDIDVLPNRASDSLSHKGVAREIATLTKLSLKKERDTRIEKDASSHLTISLPHPERARRYAGAYIKGIEVKPSPLWLQEYLESLGQKSINNVVDATNFIMFKTGQPLHAFDADTLTKDNDTYHISVDEAPKEYEFQALDGTSYTITKGDLMIVDAHADRPLAIAGIKGGKHADVNEKTKNIIIESANFEGTGIRKTSQRLKLRTEASQRFENEISETRVPEGLLYVTELIQTLAGGEFIGAVDEYPVARERHTIRVSRKKTNSLLGSELKETDIETILSALDFSYEKSGESYIITPPHERLDLEREEEIIEEIGRVYGYSNIVASIPHKLHETPAINQQFFWREFIRDLLVRKGFSEVYTYSFTSTGSIELHNPLASDKKYLRESLEGGLVQSLAFNEAYADLLGVEQIKIFEIGTVFKEEREFVALGLGFRTPRKNTNDHAQLYDLISELEEELGVSLEKDAITKEGIFEIDLERLIEGLPILSDTDVHDPYKEGIKNFLYTPISPYPFVLRDIALWVPEKTSVDDVKEVLEKNATDLLKRTTLFDEFKKEGRVSYAFRLVFQSHEKTLTDDEVNSIMEKINTAIGEKNWEVR